MLAQTKLKNGLLILMLAATVISCKKESPAPGGDLAPPNTTGDINDFFSRNQVSAQLFSVAVASVQTVVGVKGTTITIPALAFKTKNGTQILGTVQLSLTELYGKKDMLLNKAPSTTPDDLLNSQGEVKITAMQGEETLILNSAKTLTINFPASTTPGNDFQAFYGSKDLLSGNLNWLPDTLFGFVNSATPVVTDPMSYQIISDSLNWINCGRFNATSGSKTSFSITVHGNYNSSNTEIFLSFPGIKSIAHLQKASAQVYTSDMKLPIGMAFTIVAISKIGSKFYASYTNSTITLNHSQDINLSETSENDILTKLGTL